MRRLLILMVRRFPTLIVLAVFMPLILLVAGAILIGDALFHLLRPRLTKELPSLKPPSADAASLIVLNWNGKELLAKGLPSVLAAVSYDGGVHEVIVVDNGSDDGSVDFVRAEFPEVKIVTLDRNYRFARGNNLGVHAACNDIVILLNNDMVVDKDFFRPLLVPFQEPDIFAVGSQIFFQDKEAHRAETGKTRGYFNNGWVQYLHDEITMGDEKAGYVPILWGSGGACAYDRDKFLAIGGLDTLYAPFYVEDLDLSYQAWKRGWRSLVSTKSMVMHKHRGTSRPKFGDRYVDNVTRKNSYLFFWKNITDGPMIRQHLANLPRILAGGMRIRGIPFEAEAFLWAMWQSPEALYKRYACWPDYHQSDAEVFRSANMPSMVEGKSYIDFAEAAFQDQLGYGWYALEGDGERWFRWMGRRSICYLRSDRSQARHLTLNGYVPQISWQGKKGVRLNVRVNNLPVSEHVIAVGEEVRFQCDIAPQIVADDIVTIEIELDSSYVPAMVAGGDDWRDLGMMVFNIFLSSGTQHRGAIAPVVDGQEPLSNPRLQPMTATGLSLDEPPRRDRGQSLSTSESGAGQSLLARDVRPSSCQ